MDGRVVIPLDNTAGWIRMPGSTGLEMPPTEVISSASPGVYGSTVQDVRVQERPVFIPIHAHSDTSQASFFQMMDTLRSLIDPLTGSFRLVGSTSRTVREMVVTYDGGLEGADGGDSQGLSWAKVGLRATAHSPYAQAMEDRSLEFRFVSNAAIFMGVAGGTDATWPTSLSSESVVGSGMQVAIYSEAPVYPALTLIGAMTSFSGTLSPVVTNLDGTTTTITQGQWAVDVPLGVAAGSTMKLITDPRIRSIRLDGSLAAGRVARGSTLRPFYPGINILDVTAPGGTEDTRVILSWRELYRSLW
jgi:hypothetical protein